MNALRINTDFLLEYISRAPLALAMERTLECSIYAKMPFVRPLLDLGCGDGLFARILFADRIDTGVDSNRRELDRARELNIYNELIQCPGESIPKPDSSYKTIFSNSTLEHVPNLEAVLREVYRLLSPGGRLYLTVPSDRFEQFTIGNQILVAVGLSRMAVGFRKLYNSFWRHYHYYSLDDWRKKIANIGFKIIHALTYDPKYLCLLNDLLAPLGFIGVVTKQFLNRWTLIPDGRRLIFYPAYLFLNRLLKSDPENSEGGLVFIAALKEN